MKGKLPSRGLGSEMLASLWRRGLVETVCKIATIKNVYFHQQSNEAINFQIQRVLISIY